MSTVHALGGGATVTPIRECAACGAVATAHHTIHRDGFELGPQVPLCIGCGSSESPSCEEIWQRIAERMDTDG